MFNLTSLPSCNFAILSSRWQLGEVDSTEGAGLDLDPETQGMRVTKAWWMFLKHLAATLWGVPVFSGRPPLVRSTTNLGNPASMREISSPKLMRLHFEERRRTRQSKVCPVSFLMQTWKEPTCFHDFSWCYMMFRFTDILLIHSLLLQCTTFFLAATPCCVQVETIFGKNFRDGVLLTIKRESWSIQKWTASWTNTCTR